MTNPRDDLMALADRLRELVFRQGQIDWDALIKIEIDLRLAASRPAPQVVGRDAVAQAVTSELEKMHKDGVPMCMREGEATWRTYFAGFDLSMFAIRISDAILSLLRPAEPVEAKQRGTWNASKHDEIIKRLMEQVGMPNSRSLYQAFKQFANELHHIDLEASATAPKPPAQPDTSAAVSAEAPALGPKEGPAIPSRGRGAPDS